MAGTDRDWTLDDIRAQFAMLQEIRTDQEGAAATVNQIELIRRQLYDLKTIVSETEDAGEIVTAADALDAKLIEVESRLIQLKDTGGDRVRWPSMVVGRLGYLSGNVGTADFPPTDQHREVHAILRQELTDAEAELDRLLGADVADFNRMVRDRGLSPVIITQQ